MNFKSLSIFKSVSAASVLAVAASMAQAGNMTDVVVDVVPMAPPPAAAAYDWSGFYGGLSYASVDPRGTSDAGAADDDGFDDNSTVGVFGGYQIQRGNFVYGGELHYTGYDSDFEDFPGFGIEDIIELSGRVGYAFDNLMVFGSLGYAQVDYFGTPDPAIGPLNGYSVGLGVDYAVTDNVIVGLEYVHRDMDDEVPSVEDMTIEDNSIRLRLAYKF